MLIADLVNFKKWLKTTFLPIYGFDTGTDEFTSYLVALVKKERPEDEMRSLCLSQLDVFLQEKTTEFVEKLLDAIRARVYLPAAVAAPVTKPISKHHSSSDIPSGGTTTTTSSTTEGTKKKTKADSSSKDDKHSRSGRSRSPAKDRDGDRRRHGYDRRRSPPLRLRNRYDRYDDSRRNRRGGSRDRQARSMSRSRSRTRSRSRSPLSNKARRPRSGSADSRTSTPPLPSSRATEHGDIDYRDKRPAVSGASSSVTQVCTVAVNSATVVTTTTQPVAPGTGVISLRMRCRDYDEKGYCMRGDMCPFDHGTDPVVVDDVNLPNVLSFQPNTATSQAPGLNQVPGGAPVVAHPSMGGPPPAMSGPPPAMSGPPPAMSGPPPAMSGPLPTMGAPNVAVPPNMSGPPPNMAGPLPNMAGPPPNMAGPPPNMAGPPPNMAGPPPNMAGPPPNMGGPPPTLGGPPPPAVGGLPPPPSMGTALMAPMRGPAPQVPPRGMMSQLPPSRVPVVNNSAPPPATQRFVPPPINNNQFRPADKPPPPPGTMPVSVPHNSQFPPPMIAIQQPIKPEGFHPDEPYNPEAPAMHKSWDGAPPPPGGYHPGTVSRQRDLVRVPTEGQAAVDVSTIEPTVAPSNRTVLPSKRVYDTAFQPANTATMHDSVPRIASSGGGKKFDFARLGPHSSTAPPSVPPLPLSVPPHPHHPAHRRPFNTAESATLEMRKVPSHMNNIAKLNEHFSKFGTIVNLQVSVDGDAEAALVTFASHGQAKAAYRCSEPVFNNRFIKIFWHNPQQSQQQQPTAGSTTTPGAGPVDGKVSVKDRLGSIPPKHKLQLNNRIAKPAIAGNNNTTGAVVVPGRGGGVTRTIFNPASTSACVVGGGAGSSNPIGATGGRLVARIDPKQRRREAVKKTMEIAKQKQLLLQKQIEQQKLLIDKIGKKKSMSADERQLFVTTVKQLADSMATLKKELAIVNQTAVVAASCNAQQHHVSTRQQTQRAILDTELDIMTKKNQGSDTSLLRKKVADLKREAMSLGLIGGSAGRGGGFSRSAGRGGAAGRGYARGSHTVDRRPKRLKVHGFLMDEREHLLSHMALFGEVQNTVFNDRVPSVIVDYRTRHGAEKMMREGHDFNGSMLAISWFKEALSSTSASSPSYVGSDLMVKVEGGAPTSVKQEQPHDSMVLEVGRLDDREILADDVDEDLLLGAEDDEEDEEEARSWRR